MDDVQFMFAKMEIMDMREEQFGVLNLFDYAGNIPGTYNLGELDKLQDKCLGLVNVLSSGNDGPLLATLTFCDWAAAVNAAVGLWELRLDGIHRYTPELPDGETCSEEFRATLDERLEQTFLLHLLKLKEGEAVNRCEAELKTLLEDLEEVLRQLKQQNSLEKWTQLTSTKRDLQVQISHLQNQSSEFIRGLESLQHCLSSRRLRKHESFDSEADENTDDLPLFKLEDPWCWHRVHCILERETQRLNARLPLYAKRGDIVRHVQSNQVIILIGETASGKSTQLVQYLADVGFANDKMSIACTQPRRVAAMSLAHRVAEECQGCSKIGYIVSLTSETQPLANIMYITDYMLLKLCLLDPDLVQFSCIVVDEAHERSLNTDLLLAMLKRCLVRRLDMKLVIMSATADADQLSRYFEECCIYHVPGRNFPVQFRYEPGDKPLNNNIHYNHSRPDHTCYVIQVVQKVAAINIESEEGTILAFLTSQAEVEWACTQYFGPNVTVLPLHGRLRHEEQQLVFKPAPLGIRKIVFATNVAETSITIPDIRFVVDCGLAKESCVDPQNGMNVLRVCPIDRSAAIQRAGRAGRTQLGICYRLYSQGEFEAMPSHRKPEVLRVHLGLAVLKLLALGVQDIECFDFVESPPLEAIALAVKNLRQLGALKGEKGEWQLTPLGWQLVKLGVDPRLGRIVLEGLARGLGREGLTIAGLLSCSGSIFFRAGTDEEKARSDCLKIRFCHMYGDLFTLLSVYQEWDMLRERDRNKWCVENSINAKSIRRCQDSVKELEWCLKNELYIDVPSDFSWSLLASEECNMTLRKVILTAMSSNLAVFSGHLHTGYDVVSSGSQAYLHPSSSVLVFGHMPEWVVFGEILCTSREFLMTVTVVEPDWLLELHPPPFYDICLLKRSRLHKAVISNLSRLLLNRLRRRYGRDLNDIVRAMQCGRDARCVIEADYNNCEIQIYTTSEQMQTVQDLVIEAVRCEQRWMNNECIEKCLFDAPPGKSSPVLLFAAGAEIRQLLMQGEYISVNVFFVDPSAVDDNELLTAFDMCSNGIAGFHKDSSRGDQWEGKRKWGVVTFCSAEGAIVAVNQLNGVKLGKELLEVRPLIMSNPSNKYKTCFPAVNATLSWPRRPSKGYAIVQCADEDIDLIVRSCNGMLIKGSRLFCRRDRTNSHGLFMGGLQSQVTETDLAQALQFRAGCTILNVAIPRKEADPQPSTAACEASLIQELLRFVPTSKFQVIVRNSDPKDYSTIARIKFDESEHENAAKAIAHLQGKTLSICQSWQTITCKQTFFSSMHCPGPIFSILKRDISDLVEALQQQNKGAKLQLTLNENRTCYVKISADNLGVVAGCKSALEKLIEGTPVDNEQLDACTVRLLFTREGFQILKSVESQTRTYIACDKRSQTAKVHGSTGGKERALKSLSNKLLELKKKNQSHEIRLQGEGRPCGLMREIVKMFGPDLVGLKKIVPGAYIILNHRRHSIFVQGSKEDSVKLEQKIEEIMQSLEGSNDESVAIVEQESCAICFCAMEDKYHLEGCGHGFCKSCLLDQINSVVRHREGFPLTCAYEGCTQLFLIADFMALLPVDLLEELQKASLSAFVASSRDRVRFCTTPDCPAVYRVSEDGQLFACGACSVQLCTTCHVEYHLGLSCEQYKQFKQDPDASLKAWRKGKQHVKNCPSCGNIIEKVDGCNHVICKCKKHLCWLCLMSFTSSEICYNHLQTVHGGFYVG